MSITKNKSTLVHGTIDGYTNHRCRCEPCKKAKKVDARRNFKAKRARVAKEGTKATYIEGNLVMDEEELNAWLALPSDPIARAHQERSESTFKVLTQREIAELRQRRHDMSNEERILALVSELRTVSSAIVKGIARSAASASTSAEPHADTGVGDLTDKRTDQYINDLNSDVPRDRLAALYRLEHAMDIHRGRHRIYASQTKDERETRLLEEFEGHSPEQCKVLDPSLGTNAMIRDIRKQDDRDPQTGVKQV